MPPLFVGFYLCLPSSYNFFFLQNCLQCYFLDGMTKLFQMSTLLYHSLPTARALMWKVLFLKVYIVKSSIKNMFKMIKISTDWINHLHKGAHTLRSHLSHAQQALQRLENCYQTVGSADQRAPPRRGLRSPGTQAAVGQRQHRISS